MARTFNNATFPLTVTHEPDGTHYAATIEIHSSVRVTRRQKALFLRLLQLAETFGVMVRLIPQRDGWRRDLYCVIMVGRREQLDRWHRMKVTHKFIEPKFIEPAS